MPDIRVVTYHDTELMPHMRVCANLACPVDIYSPRQVYDIQCPNCKDRAGWKVVAMQYVIEKDI